MARNNISSIEINFVSTKINPFREIKLAPKKKILTIKTSFSQIIIICSNEVTIDHKSFNRNKIHSLEINLTPTKNKTKNSGWVFPDISQGNSLCI